MLRKSLYLSGALAGALLYSTAALAAPGHATGNVNMRSGPGTSYPVIAQIPAGAALDIGNCGGWCQITYAGRSGYVSASYVTAARSAPAPYAYYQPYDYDEYYPGSVFYYDDNGPFFGFGGHFSHYFHGGLGHGHGGYGHGGGHGWGGGGHGWSGGGTGGGHGWDGDGMGGGHGGGGGGHRG